MKQSSEPHEKPRTADAGTALSQFWTIGTLTRDPRIQGRHLKAAWSIFNSNYKSRGAGQASLRYIQAATRQSVHTIMRAIDELVEWGYLTREEVGSGETPSSFSTAWTTQDPVWDIRHLKAGARKTRKASGTNDDSAAHACNTKDDKITAADDCSRGAAHACSAISDSTAHACSESGLSLTGLTGLKIKKEFDSAAQPGTAPPADAAGGPVGVEEGFDVLWRTYKFPQKKLEARVAYSKLNPDPSLFARLIDSAIAWREAWERQGKPDAPRKHLATWLMDESWDCDAPGKPFVKNAKKASKPASKPKPIPTPANSNVPERNWQRVEVVASKVEEAHGVSKLHATLKVEGGCTFIETITLQHANQTEQDRGQKQFEKLRWAMDLNVIDDSSELHGIPFERRVYNGKSEYRAAAKDIAA